MIGDETFWEGTAYEDLLLEKEGGFTIQGGQHSVTYEEDESLGEGQYYLYMFNNNIGISTSNPSFDWSSVGLTENTSKNGETSYYYKYLVDENAGSKKELEQACWFCRSQLLFLGCFSKVYGL